MGVEQSPTENHVEWETRDKGKPHIQMRATAPVAHHALPVDTDPAIMRVKDHSRQRNALRLLRFTFKMKQRGVWHMRSPVHEAIDRKTFLQFYSIGRAKM
jgi:hypothetical protein